MAQNIHSIIITDGETSSELDPCVNIMYSSGSVGKVRRYNLQVEMNERLKEAQEAKLIVYCIEGFNCPGDPYLKKKNEEFTVQASALSYLEVPSDPKSITKVGAKKFQARFSLDASRLQGIYELEAKVDDVVYKTSFTRDSYEKCVCVKKGPSA